MTIPTHFSLDTDTPREAITHFELVETRGRHALLRVVLETGRTHQIRVHLAAIGLPVVGDSVYGVPEPALGRQFLHAARLAFPHPFTGERVEAESAAARWTSPPTSTVSDDRDIAATMRSLSTLDPVEDRSGRWPA